MKLLVFEILDFGGRPRRETPSTFFFPDFKADED